MQFTLSLSLATSLLASLVAAGVDPKACNGVGACLQSNDCNYSGGYDCGSQGTIGDQEAASVKVGISNGDYDYATDAEFPAKCELKDPSSTSVKIKKTKNGTTYYAFAEFTCTTTTLVDDCYNANPNPSYYYVCKAFKNGEYCKPTGVVTSPAAC